MPNPLFAVLEAQRAALVSEITFGFATLNALLTSALLAHTAGEFTLAKKLLNQALDVEHDLTGDCATLGPLAESWGVDHELDR